MKNVAILIYDATVMGGAENVALALANELAPHHTVTVISLFNKNEKLFFDLTEKIEYILLSKKIVSITFHINKISKAIKAIIMKNQIDIVFCITAGVVTSAIKAVKNTKTKLIYCEHSNLQNNSYGFKHRVRQWLGAKYSDWIVTLTNEDLKAFQEKYNTRSISSIYNWYNHEITGIEYNILSKKIITVGRFVKLKGYDNLVDIANIVLRDFPDWTWDIYGDGEEFVRIQNKIIQFGLEGRLVLKGRCKNITEIYKNYALFVLTSKFEGLPMVLLEAQANQLPIVSFKCPTGPKEIIEDNVNGFLVKPDDIKEMIKKIEELLKNVHLRTYMSKHSMDDFEKFTKENVLAQWLDLIENICAENS